MTTVWRKGPTMREVIFDVLGTPTPQGSKTKMPNGAMVEGGSKTQREARRHWRGAVAWQAREVAAGRPPLDGPLSLDVEFRFAMPSSRRKAEREAGRIAKVTAPDLDKLVRSVGDGLQAGGLIRDDARIYQILARKVEVVGWTGATIRLGYQPEHQKETTWLTD